jgi:hypothetical protein
VTAILVAVGPRFAVMAADAQQSHGGQPYDEAMKLTIVAFRDGRLVMASTGLASWGLPVGHTGPAGPARFRTVEWVNELLAECAPPDYTMEGTLQRLTARLSTDFPPPMVRPREQYLVLVCAGQHFQDLGEGRMRSVPVYATVRNDPITSGPPEPADTFKLRIDRGSSGLTGSGNVPAIRAALSAADVSEDDLESGHPSKVVHSLTQAIQRAAATPAGTGTVSSRSMTVVLMADPNIDPISRHHADRPGSTIYLPHMVDVRGPGFPMARYLDPRVIGTGATAPAGILTVPTAPKNAPCPCGTGRRYRYCHGRVERADGYTRVGLFRWLWRHEDDFTFDIHVHPLPGGTGITHETVVLRPE